MFLSVYQHLDYGPHLPTCLWVAKGFQKPWPLGQHSLGIMPGAAGTAQCVEAVGLMKRKLEYSSTCYCSEWMVSLRTVCGGWGGTVSNHNSNTNTHSSASTRQEQPAAVNPWRRVITETVSACGAWHTNRTNCPFQNNGLVRMLGWDARIF